MELNTQLKAAIQNANFCFQKSNEDRNKLHQVEWDSNSKFSILGEVEVWCSELMGIAKTLADGRQLKEHQDPERYTTKSIFTWSEDTSVWIVEYGVQYRKRINKHTLCLKLLFS